LPDRGGDHTKETTMSTNPVVAKVGMAIVTAVVPTMLLAGTGTAHAEQWIGVWARSAPGGVDVVVQSGAGGGEVAPSGWCTYTSTVQGNPIGKPLPAIDVPFYISPDNGSARLWFPSYPTGSTWNVTVSCPNGVVSTEAVW
jgi:hypothetical protein